MPPRQAVKPSVKHDKAAVRATRTAHQQTNRNAALHSKVSHHSTTHDGGLGATQDEEEASAL